MGTQKTTPMTVRDIPIDLRNQFKAKAILEGKTMQQKIVELMQGYVADLRNVPSEKGE